MKAYIIKLSICVSIFVFAVLFWWPATIICGAVICFFIAAELSVKSVTYILFFTSFENVLREWYGFQLITIIFLGVCVFQYLRCTSRTEKKQFKILAIGILVYLVYCLIVSIATLGKSSYLTLGIHMLILFFLCNLKKDLDFKKLVYFFIAGILTASFIGSFIELLPLLRARTLEFWACGLLRFSGLTGNPNRLPLHVFAAINGLFILDIKKQISLKQFLPLLAVLFALGLSTISRTFCFVMVLNFAAYAGLKFWYERGASLKQIALTCLVFLAVCGVLYQYTTANLMRLGFMPERAIVKESAPKPEHEKLSDFTSLWDEDIEDPGRVGIWKRNIKEWLSSPVTFFFGNGLGSTNFGMPHTHNLYIFLAIKTGLVGILLFAFFLFTLFYNMFKVKKYKFNLASLLFLVTFAVHSILELKFPAITGFIFFFMFIFCLEKPDEKDALSGEGKSPD